jgi:hypothetical protein
MPAPLLTNKKTGQPRKATPYEFGYQGEIHLVRALKGIGFACTRSAASHGPWDVMAVRGDIACLIQAKRGGRPSPCDYKTLTDLVVPTGGQVLKLLVWLPSGLQQGRVLYCADGSGPVALPEWCGSIGWQYGPPPKQGALRLS